MKETLNIDGWELEAFVDGDGHLTLVINHEDTSKVIPLEEDLATTEEEWVERFTTEKIEEDYQKSIN